MAASRRFKTQKWYRYRFQVRMGRRNPYRALYDQIYVRRNNNLHHGYLGHLLKQSAAKSAGSVETPDYSRIEQRLLAHQLQGKRTLELGEGTMSVIHPETGKAQVLGTVREASIEVTAGA